MKRTIAVLVTLVGLLITMAPMPMLHPQAEAATTAVLNHNQRRLPNGTNLPYYEYLPEGYGTRPFALLVFFHGIGECGDGSETQLRKVLTHGPPKLIEGGKAFDAIVISPQLPPDAEGKCDKISWSTSITVPFVDAILSKYNVDRDRIYITGLSLGGGGTWMYAKARPNLVAAIVPVCGNGSSTGSEILRGMPIWAFHYEVDPDVPYSLTTSKLQVITGTNPELNRPQDNRTPGYTGSFNGTSWVWRYGQAAPPATENPILTTYEGSSHAAWTPAYNNEAMWSWLFAQRRPTGGVVFQQDFQGSTSVSSYVHATNPDTGQVNDITAEPTGGTWSINQGRLQLARTGSDTTDNDAGITRHTDFPGPPNVLHLTFDVSASDWSTSTFQSGAMQLTIGKFTSVTDYGSGEAAINRFETLGVRGKGPGQLAVTLAGVESAALAADGRLHQVAVFLNKQTTAASYRAPNGSVHTLRAGGVALWVNNTLVVETNAYNGTDSTLADLRVRFSTADDATWTLDNIVIRNVLPQ